MKRGVNYKRALFPLEKGQVKSLWASEDARGLRADLERNGVKDIVLHPPQGQQEGQHFLYLTRSGSDNKHMTFERIQSAVEHMLGVKALPLNDPLHA